MAHRIRSRRLPAFARVAVPVVALALLTFGFAPTAVAEPQGPTATSAHHVDVSVYFLRDEAIAVGAGRPVEPPAVLEAALEALLEGPNQLEQGIGMGTEIPGDTELLGVAITDRVAFVDLSGAFEAGGGTLSMTARLAQLVYTATQFPTVDSVRIELDGQLRDVFSGEGLIIDEPLDRVAFEFGGAFGTLAPVILPEEPRPGDTVAPPLRTWGSSNTFEATVLLELVADDGTTLIPETRFMATSGTGTRGTFDVTVPFTAAPQGPATLRLFERSARDGSRVNVVEVPVEVVGQEEVNAYGDAQFFGSTRDLTLNQPVVGMWPTPSDQGYWLVAGDGGIFSFGDAVFRGSTGDLVLNEPIVNMAGDPAGRGYWTVASDGGVFSFGVPFHGSMGGIRLNQPVVAMAPTQTGEGYWLVASDGGAFSFGDAAFAGSTGDMVLNQPVVGMAADPDGAGYWLVAADGGIFSFDAQFHGSAVGRLGAGDQAVGMAAAPDGGGYWVATRRGEVLAFGTAAQLGDASDVGLDTVAIAGTSTGGGYWLAHVQPREAVDVDA